MVLLIFRITEGGGGGLLSSHFISLRHFTDLSMQTCVYHVFVSPISEHLRQRDCTLFVDKIKKALLDTRTSSTIELI